MQYLYTRGKISFHICITQNVLLIFTFRDIFAQEICTCFFLICRCLSETFIETVPVFTVASSVVDL
jgi:hypothetical protein